MNKRFLNIGLTILVFLVPAACLAAQQGAPAPAQSQQAAPAAQASPTPAQAAPASRQQSSTAPQEAAPAAENKTAQLPPTNDPKEIVRRAMEIDHRTLELARNYTCEHREVLKHLGKHGEVRSTEIKTYDINFYYGQEYSRLIQIDDKPLSAKEQKKEDEKLEKFLAKYRNESDEDRQKRLEKEKKQREEGRAYVHDVVNAYDFRLLGEEPVDGVDSLVIEATPRGDFHPTQPHADMLKKVKGKLWIEKKEYNWVKVEAVATDTISYGLFLFRIHPGSRFVLEKTLVNNEVWLLRRLDINGGARIALLKNEIINQEDVISNFKKFSTSVRIVPGVKEVQPAEQPK